jgi:hypothetical protein
MFARMMPRWAVSPLLRCLTASRIDSGSSALQSAGHAVLRTLYSRAYRIGLNEASCLLCGLCENVSFEWLLVNLGRMFAQPTLELIIPLEKQLKCFADDVGRICADELGVFVQVVSDFFLQTNLKGCGFRLFRRCFQ